MGYFQQSFSPEFHCRQSPSIHRYISDLMLYLGKQIISLISFVSGNLSAYFLRHLELCLPRGLWRRRPSVLWKCGSGKFSEQLQDRIIKTKIFQFKRKRQTLLARMPLKCSSNHVLQEILSETSNFSQMAYVFNGSQIFYKLEGGNFYLVPSVYQSSLDFSFLPFCLFPVRDFPNEQITGTYWVPGQSCPGCRPSIGI